jgi:hypothetical protein
MLDELAAGLVGVRVGQASCAELERHLPYVPLASALRDALDGVQIDVHRRPALCRVLPELEPGTARDEHADVEVLEALVAVIGEHGPLVLLIDDLHWADEATLAALSYLRNRAGVAAAVVATVRSEQAPQEHTVRRLRPDLVVRLAPLTQAELAPLGIPELHDATGGNPRFVAETIASNSRRELSAALAETLLAQCRSEGAWAYRVLLVASVLEQPFEPERLATLLRFDAAELVEELERLCERRILRVEGDRFRFLYQLVRQVLLASLSPARQRLLRQRLEPGERSSPLPTARAASAMRG